MRREQELIVPKQDKNRKSLDSDQTLDSTFNGGTIEPLDSYVLNGAKRLNPSIDSGQAI
jgi:hypothetical protein